MRSFVPQQTHEAYRQQQLNPNQVIIEGQHTTVPFLSQQGSQQQQSFWAQGQMESQAFPRQPVYRGPTNTQPHQQQPGTTSFLRR
mmetsp:Transcript_6098/g.7687  ORF Transcript_6098/g.7687 Transcript_6098/m.7687 type:complete len:85 (+) Transcript_6098:137-391(+)